jgi:hypothetical protein
MPISNALPKSVPLLVQTEGMPERRAAGCDYSLSRKEKQER